MANIFELFGEIIIKNTDANKKIDETTGKAKDLADALNKAGNGAKDAGEQFEDAGEKAETAGDKFGKDGKFSAGAVALGNLLSDLADKAWDLSKQLFDMGISYNSNMEYYHASISTMLSGDAEAAAKMIGQLQELSVNTPLHFLDLMDSAKTMLSYGVAAEDVVGYLTMMGDVAIGDTNKLKSLAYAVSQVFGYQELRAQEANQIINAGFPLWEYLEKVTGESKEALMEMNVAPDSIIAAFKLAVSEGEAFFGQMDTMITTYGGQLEKIKETGEITAGALTEPLFKLLRDEAFPRIQETLEGFLSFLQENPDLLQSWADSIGDLAVYGFEKITDGLKWMISNENSVKTALEAIAAGLGACLAVAHPYAAALAAIIAALQWLDNDGLTKVSKTITEKTGGAVNTNVLIKNSETGLTLAEEERRAAYEKEMEEADTQFEKAMAKGNYVRSALGLSNEQFLKNMGMEVPSLSKPSSKQPMKLPDADASTDEIEKWFETLDPELKKKIGIEFPDSATSTLEVLAWWEEVRPKLVAYYYTEPGGTLEFVKEGYHTKPLGSFATGLDFVPRDNFIARLHKGEAVLTAKENSEYRQMKNGGDVGAAIAQLTDAINELQEGFQTNMNLYVNKKHVASALSRDMGRSIGNREYTLVRGMGG